jgi:hypothetical protein
MLNTRHFSVYSQVRVMYESKKRHTRSASYRDTTLFCMWLTPVSLSMLSGSKKWAHLL